MKKIPKETRKKKHYNIKALHMTNLQPISHFHLITISLKNGEIFKAFTLRSEKAQGCPVLFNVDLKDLGREIR